MSTHIALQPAYVLHKRPFKDTSFLIDLFTANHGRLTVVGKGIRGPRSKLSGILQPFTPLLVSWSGKSELQTLSKAEANGTTHFLSGNVMASGFYLNELITRVLHKHDPYPETFKIYEKSLISLANENNISSLLRIFEKNLLKSLGYGLQLNVDQFGAAIEPTSKYIFKYGVGLTKIPDKIEEAPQKFALHGSSILALHNEKFGNNIERQEAQILLNIALAPLIGSKPIKSRELWVNG